jgi:hypothetical protein
VHYLQTVQSGLRGGQSIRCELPPGGRRPADAAGRRARPGGPRCRTCRGPTRALRILRLREDSAAASVREIDWLHTHVPDGVIHLESPVRRGFTLGDFFDEWGLPLSTDQVGPAKGRVTAFYDGKVYQGNPRDIPLVDKAQIQLDVGTPLIPPT